MWSGVGWSLAALLVGLIIFALYLHHILIDAGMPNIFGGFDGFVARLAPILPYIVILLPVAGFLFPALNFEQIIIKDKALVPNLLDTERRLKVQRSINSKWLKETVQTEKRELLDQPARWALAAAKDCLTGQNKIIRRQLEEIEFARMQNRVELHLSSLENGMNVPELNFVDSQLRGVQNDLDGRRPKNADVKLKYLRLKESIVEIRRDLINRCALALAQSVKSEPGRDELISGRVAHDSMRLVLDANLLGAVHAQEFDRERFRLESVRILERQI